MPKKWTHAEACQIAGELYGRILGRNADKDGFDFVVDRLVTGMSSPRDLVRQMVMSDEFREKFVMNQTANELARQVLLKFSGDRNLTPEGVKSLAIAFLERDWRVVIRDVVNGNGYMRAYSDNQVPDWMEEKTSPMRKVYRRA